MVPLTRTYRYRARSPMRGDLDAVIAGHTLEYDFGPVDGIVNRIKQSKMAMYRRAKPNLLRKLVLLA